MPRAQVEKVKDAAGDADITMVFSQDTHRTAHEELEERIEAESEPEVTVGHSKRRQSMSDPFHAKDTMLVSVRVRRAV